MPVPLTLPPIAVFDLDGTLVDTAADLVASLNHAMAIQGVRQADPRDLAPWAGHGGRGMLRHHCGTHAISLDEAVVEAIIAEFLAHYGACLPGVSTTYPGVMGIVSILRAEGWKTAICTNKPQHLADRLMEGLGLTQAFDTICGADRFAMRKPDPAHLMLTIEAAGGDPRRAVMVGDSQTDIDTARNAAIPVVAVDFGYSPVPVATLGPDAVISAYDADALALLRKLAAG